MGHFYAQMLFGIDAPRVGLLSIGEEEGKGNELTKETYRVLKETGLNFIGNAEGRDVYNGNADVVVCDGFIGNVVLKASEALGEFVSTTLRAGDDAHAGSASSARLLAKSAFDGLKKRMDYSEYGGAPLLGVKGGCIVCHGRSNAKAIKNAIRVARNFAINRSTRRSWPRSTTSTNANTTAACWRRSNDHANRCPAISSHSQPPAARRTSANEPPEPNVVEIVSVPNHASVSLDCGSGTVVKGTTPLRVDVPKYPEVCTMEVGADDYRPLRMKFNRGLVLKQGIQLREDASHQLDQSASTLDMLLFPLQNLGDRHPERDDAKDPRGLPAGSEADSDRAVSSCQSLSSPERRSEARKCA